MTPEEIHDKGKEILGTKRQDYTTNDRYENFTRCAEVASWFERDIDKVFVTLITVKIARLASLLGREKITNHEAIDDTFLDLCNYVALWGGKVIRPSVQELEQILNPRDERTSRQASLHSPDVAEVLDRAKPSR